MNQAAEEVVSASDKAQQAIDSIQEAIITTTQKAEAAAASATEQPVPRQRQPVQSSLLHNLKQMRQEVRRRLVR